MNDQHPPLVLPGQRVPFCYGIGTDRHFYSFEGQAGRPAAMILAHQVAPPDLLPLIHAFACQSEAFTSRQADILVLGTEDMVRGLAGDAAGVSAIRMVDCGIGFPVRCGVQPGVPMVLVTDRNLRVARRLVPGQTPDIVAACLDCLDELPREEPRDISLPAPVLVLPNLLSRELCRGLIETFEGGISIDGGVASIDAAGIPQGRVNHNTKRRRDFLIPPGEALEQGLRRLLLDRCAPEIAKAFQAHIAHTDRLLIARYDEAESWFRRHRDNTAENVAFREFAISVNLNAEEYEGGYLLFPEYNDHRYRVPTGGGLIFSSSVLHEAVPVTRGRRYVLLTFFHSEAAEARRQAYLARTKDSPSPCGRGLGGGGRGPDSPNPTPHHPSPQSINPLPE
jgi:predicted 2-oxoglutarate/Fe(II)-dependent dioxygenase YbiX